MPKTKQKQRTIFDIDIGIDPGGSGGLVILTDRGDPELQPMPPTGRDLWNWFDFIPGCNSYRVHATIEWIHPAIQGVGKSSMSKLYGNYMSLRMCLIASEIPFEDVKPREWQSGLGIPTRKKSESQGQWKDRLRGKAQELFPDLDLWKQKRNKGVQLSVCDALLIAEYGRRKRGGLL